jgi:hypothetical protein
MYPRTKRGAAITFVEQSRLKKAIVAILELGFKVMLGVTR